MNNPHVNAAVQLPQRHLRFSTLANKITVARLAVAVLLFVAMEFGWWRSALLLFALAIASDAIDGYLARKRNEVTAIGRILDPFADKIVVVGAFVLLIPEEVGVQPWMVVIIIARELLISSIRGFLESVRVPFGADIGGKIKMVLQSLCVAWILLVLGAGLRTTVWASYITLALLWTTVLATLLSGLNYFFRATALLRGAGASAAAA